MVENIENTDAETPRDSNVDEGGGENVDSAEAVSHPEVTAPNDAETPGVETNPSEEVAENSDVIQEPDGSNGDFESEDEDAESAEASPGEEGGVVISSPDPLPLERESDDDQSAEPAVQDETMVEADDAETIETIDPESADQSEDEPETSPAEPDMDNTEAPTVRLARPPIESEYKTTQVEIQDAESANLRKIKISCHNCGQKLDVTFLEPFSLVDCPSCESEIIIPKWFDNYLLEEPGGIGGMATVYRALDLGLDREVAIKVLNPDFATNGDKGELFLHEARTAATINHYAVIPVYTCGEYEDQPYIVMQFMEGGSLEMKLKMSRSKLDVQVVSKWIRDVADGLDNAKRHGIIHHDVKPGNIMLDSEGNPKIGDFGIAQAINDTRTEKIQEFTKTWISPHYVSPEKVATGKEDFLGDVYSLGATYYHLVTGHTPFEEDDVNQLIRMRLFKDPIEPEKLRPEIPSQVSKLIVRMMDRDPDNRPKYRDVIKDINAYLSKAPKSKRSIGKKSVTKKVTKRNMVLKGAADKPKLDHLASYRTSREKPFSAWIYRAIVISVLVGAAVFLHKSGKGRALYNHLTGAEASASLEVPEDRLPSATREFAVGNPEDAGETARRAAMDDQADLETRAQAGAQLAIAEYLLNSPDAAARCAKIAKSLTDASLDEGDSRLAIVFFLANDQISDNALIDRLEDEPHMSLLGRLAILLRSFHGGAARGELGKTFNEYKTIANVSDADFWGNAWRDRLSDWEDVVFEATGDPDELEPLFRKGVRRKRKTSPSEASEKRLSETSKNDDDDLGMDAIPPSTTNDGDDDSLDEGAPRSLPPIDEITLREFAASREPFADRPGGDSLEYDLISVQDYIDKLPNKAYKRAEARRFNSIKDSKEYFIKNFRMGEYRGQVKIKGKRSFKGSIALANDRVVLVRTVDRRGERKIDRYKWSQLDFQQYINFYSFFASERKKIVGPNMTEEDLKKLASEDYFRLAILCDWHGRHKEALKYAKEAVKTWSGKKREVNKILLGQSTN